MKKNTSRSPFIVLINRIGELIQDISKYRKDALNFRTKTLKRLDSEKIKKIRKNLKTDE